MLVERVAYARERNHKRFGLRKLLSAVNPGAEESVPAFHAVVTTRIACYDKVTEKFTAERDHGLKLRQWLASHLGVTRPKLSDLDAVQTRHVLIGALSVLRQPDCNRSARAC